MNNPESFIKFTKKIIDEIQFACLKKSPSYNTLNLSGLHFYDSVVVAEKNKIAFKLFYLRIGETTTVDFPDAF